MLKQKIGLFLMILALLLTACGSDEPPPTVKPPTPTEPPAVEGGPLISEVLPGVLGVNNNLEFVELYNAGAAPVDLDGWSLWYRLADNRDEELIHTWRGRADVPGHGHYLLARAGQDVGTVADATYDLALFEKKGGLALRNPGGEMVDAVVWGEGPSDYRGGAPAPAPEGGASLERLPGGEAGNGADTGDDASDFASNPAPNPQNSGDPVAPLPAERLALRLDAPASVEPGAEVALGVEVENLTGEALQDLHLFLPLPGEFEVISLPPGAEQAAGWLDWPVAALAEGETVSAQVRLQSPWTYLSALIRGAYVATEDGRYYAYGPLAPLTVEGGAIPIGTARALEGKTVTVEGIAVMYTDGFYAGSTGTKFYLEDETGGIQVYCPGGLGLVNVRVGDRVRVTGGVEVYRGAMEIVPETYPDDVAVLEPGAAEPEPTPATLTEASSDEDLLGRLVVVGGTATRIAEYTYSYEVDLMDDEGALLLVYVDKETGVTPEPLDVGKQYRVTGISEMYNATWELLPRFQSDLARVYPPELMLEVDAPNSVPPGGTLTYTLTVYNHTAEPLHDVHIEADPPVADVVAIEVLDGGEHLGEEGLAWNVSELAPGGGSATVRYRATVADDALAGGQIVAQGATAFADEWPELVAVDPLRTFVGSGVPIWAIQGAGHTSPYVRDRATTEGLVTGVFPELGGFWIQEVPADGDPATSDGLFVLAEELAVAVALGDEVRVGGKVRELSGQTLLHVASAGDVVILSADNELPLPVELNPPLDEGLSADYYEALEGMLVQVGEPAVAVGPTSKYGETPLVKADLGIERVMKGDPMGMVIYVDDGSAATHLDASNLPFALATGDTLAGVVGPLAYTYENFKIEPITEPRISASEHTLPTLAPAGPDEFSVATFNVENLFDTVDPHPSDPPIPSRSAYALDLAKTAATIEAMGAPTLVGLQEVENVDVLADLAEEPALLGYGYEPVLVEGTDSRGIDVAWLVRGDRVTLAGAAARPAPEGLTSRPPLLITVTVHLASGDQTVYLLNNHFTSMAGGEKPTEPRRKAQAAWNVTLVERILAADPEAHVVVLGDLNSFYDSPPLDVLRATGLRHVYELVEPERPYTYIYQGESETLDHILVTPGLYAHLVQVGALHVNADYPPPLPDDASPRHASDHDPLLAVFSFDLDH